MAKLIIRREGVTKADQDAWVEFTAERYALVGSTFQTVLDAQGVGASEVVGVERIRAPLAELDRRKPD